jgi:hypothetical protein
MDPPVYRYLMVIEAGASMVRQKEVALDTVHQLILSGLNGRIQRGEVLGIWPFRKEVDQTLSRPIYWRAAEARDLGNFIYRKLRDLEFSKQSSLESALAAVKNEALHSEQLTVFFVTSGGEFVRGTGFDDEINSVFRQHAHGMIAAKRPFVTVLNYEHGEAVAQAVTPGGMKIFIPPMPGAAVADAPEPAADPAKTESQPAGPAAPAPKPMSVDEIAEKLREAEAERRQRAAAESAAAQLEETAPTPPAEPPATVPVDPVGVTEAEPAPTPAVEPGPETSPTEEPQAGNEVEEATQVAEPPRQSPSPVAPAPAVTEREPVEQLTKPRETATPAVVLPGEGPGKEQRMYLWAGLGLMLAAVLLIWWRFHRPRRRAHASVISQSMNRR